MKAIMYDSVSLDGSFIKFDVDTGLHYQIAERFNADAHLIGSDSIMAGIKMFASGVLSENASDFIKPKKDTGLPYWIIVDSKGKTMGSLHKCRNFEFCRDVIVLISRKTTTVFIDYLKSRNYDYVVSGDENVNFEKAFKNLSEEHGINTIMVDSGPTLNRVLISKGLIDEISLLVSPVLVGRRSDKLLNYLNTGERNVSLRLLEYEEVNEGLLLLRYQVQKTGSHS